MEGFEGFGFRKRVHGSYLIVFRVTAREVEVLNVIHGARDYAVVLA